MFTRGFSLQIILIDPPPHMPPHAPKHMTQFATFQVVNFYKLPGGPGPTYLVYREVEKSGHGTARVVSNILEGMRVRIVTIVNT